MTFFSTSSTVLSVLIVSFIAYFIISYQSASDLKEFYVIRKCFDCFFIISLVPSKLHFFSSQVVPHLSISASLVIQLLSLLNLWFQQHKFLFHLKVNLQNVPDLKQFAVIRLVFLSSSIIFVARKFYNSNKTFIIK